jgi:hypothetical protein
MTCAPARDNLATTKPTRSPLAKNWEGQEQLLLDALGKIAAVGLEGVSRRESSRRTLTDQRLELQATTRRQLLCVGGIPGSRAGCRIEIQVVRYGVG